jgi:hypothetical protein
MINGLKMRVQGDQMSVSKMAKNVTQPIFCQKNVPQKK